VITHVISLRWTPETTPDQIERIAAALATLPGLIPSIASYRCGSDLGVNAGGHNMDFAIVATFDTIEGWREYDTDPEHARIRAEVIGPWVAQRAGVQFRS
jgi:hypothetical protein